MASLQTKFNTLPLAERQKQDEWARNQLHENGSLCPGGAAYKRDDDRKGYICASSVHLVTDVLLQEGMGRFYVALAGGDDYWVGPFGSLQEVEMYEQKPMYMGGMGGYRPGRRR